MEMQFTECIPCSKKAGIPTLCEPCIKNRSVISDLQTRLDGSRKPIDIIQSVLELNTH